MNHGSDVGAGVPERVKLVAVLVLGTLFFGGVAALHLLSVAGAASIPVLGALLVFVPAPVVFACWRVFRPKARGNRALNLVPTVYLSLGAVMSLSVLMGVSWVASERGIHPIECPTADQTLADYPDLQPLAVPVSFAVPNDGLRKGWFLPGRSEATILLLHGFGCRSNEMLQHAQVLHDEGYSTLLFDFRGRGESDGDAVTLGFYEQRDVLAAVRYLKTRDDVDASSLGVLGISMGASVAIMAAAQAPEIKAVVADSPFESAERAVKEGFTRVVGLPAFPFAPITLRIIEWRLGVSPEDIVPRNYIGAISPRPILLIHGLADTEVSPENSRILFAAAGEPKELRLLPEVEHTEGIRESTAEYSRIIVNFFDRHLG